jgi:hypothetical protein
MTQHFESCHTVKLHSPQKAQKFVANSGRPDDISKRHGATFDDRKYEIKGV